MGGEDVLENGAAVRTGGTEKAATEEIAATAIRVAPMRYFMAQGKFGRCMFRDAERTMPGLRRDLTLLSGFGFGHIPGVQVG
mmetsp:Transcript_5948/g.12654  ORF Transcript_5948/g.12654 Transcript_5948/m.12654 type:complete len:82 (+) Transcript_5948:535-780(+)